LVDAVCVTAGNDWQACGTMKTALIATVVLMSLAGASAAGMMMWKPTSIPTRTIASPVEHERVVASTPRAGAAPAPERTAAVTPPAPAGQPGAASAASSAPSGAREAVRPPVPLQLSHKRPLPDKPAASDKPDSKAGTEAQPGAEPTADQASQQAAKAAIEADGYKGVQMLNQVGNGVWKASALRGKTRIVVSVDAAGNVFTE
jgi:hypothetical protein